MIKPEMVPKEVCLALKETLFSCPWHDRHATAIAAALNAWPGSGVNHSRLGERLFILPLMEKQDDQP